MIRSVSLYYFIACGWAWLAFAPVVFGTQGLKFVPVTVSLPVFACIASLGPFFGCFGAYRVEYGSWRAVHLLPSSLSRSIWLLFGPSLILLTIFVIFPALLSRGAPAGWHWRPSALLGLWVPMFNYNLLGGPLFEEFGWRGFLLPRLQREMSPSLAAVVVGLMWAVWHFPLFFVSWSSASPATYTLIAVSLSVVFAYAFNASGGSVLVTILMHSAFNSSPRFFAPFLGPTSTRERPSEELILGLSFLLTAALITALTRCRLGFVGPSELTERRARG